MFTRHLAIVYRTFKKMSALSAVISRTKPIIWVILGSTGTGKSKLAIELAQKLGGEIISADSMQVYKRLDIVTNKVTREEQTLIRHHMLDFVEPWQRFTVVDFRNKVLPIIDNLLSENKSPVIVGGTYYYIESLLWHVLVNKEDLPESPLLYDRDELLRRKRSRLETSEKTVFYSVYQEDLNLISNETLHDELILRDTESADRIHPNDRRKVIRALQILEQTGKTMSEVLKEQRTTEGGSSLGGPLRYSNVKILWLRCQQDVLDDRLDKRVDEMITRGLVPELVKFNDSLTGTKNEKDFTNGILQSIGFKEFDEYLKLSPMERETQRGAISLTNSIEKLKLVTRRYSRKQTKWIKNRFLKCSDRPIPPVYELDATDPSQWEENVSKIAAKLVTENNDTDCGKNTIKLDRHHRDKSTIICPDCNTRLIGDIQLRDHMSSNRHKKRVYRKRKREKVREKLDLKRSVS